VADAELLLYDTDGQVRELSDEDRATIDDAKDRILTLEAEITSMEADEARFQAIADAKGRMQESTRRTPPSQPSHQAEVADRMIPARARKYGSLRAFKGPKGELQAYRFGVWFADCLGVPWARQRAIDQGIERRTSQNEGTNTQGGFLVPDEYESTIIDLKEEYGTFQRFARVVPMSSDHIKIPRRTAGSSAYLVGESEAITESNKTWDQVSLTAKKVGVLNVITSELAEDAIINIADDLAREAAYQLAYFEDLCGFKANGEGTYGGIVGVGPALTNVYGVSDDDDGVIVGTGDLPSELTLGDFNKVVALLPGYADTNDAA